MHNKLYVEAGVAMRNKTKKKKKDLPPRSSVSAGKPRGMAGANSERADIARGGQRGTRAPAGSLEEAGLRSTRKCLQLQGMESMKYYWRDKER